MDRWIGFGYLPSTNEYKVVLMYKEPEYVVVMVYTLGSRNGWRHIGKFRLKYNYIYKGHGTFANGALDWMHPKNKMILVFDLADEKFREHLSPPPSPAGASYSEFGVLGGFLVCAHRYYNPDTKKYMFSELWLYKEKNDNYDMKEHPSWGWTKEFIAIFSIPLSFSKQGCLLGYGYNYLNTGYGPCYFDIYDSKMLTMSTELPNFKEQFCQVFPHYHTFVSLKELGEEGTKIMQAVETTKRKRRD
ncbi:uncharacterized protein LOC113328124 [Papaver somniferum]|uniref:uncharacterized protein LOC113328124 n=1 Tax=Papaver somniferum TaxID=3469 RepID=UPI000E700799|nr:uncharacterized protein LOC113328124 [Papaver somniferum]